TLIPTVAFITVGGPAIGSALFAYGHFGEVDADYLGAAIALSAFTLIPYALVLLQLRVFYAREQPWTPIVIILVITTVKIVASLLAPHVTDNRELVAGYLGLANGLGFLAGAIVGYFLLRHALRPPRGQLVGPAETRTILVTVAASLLAGMAAHAADRLLGLETLTLHGGGAGSLLRLLALALIMAPIMGAVMLRARVPEARAALAAVQRWLGAPHTTAGSTPGKIARPARLSGHDRVTYAEHSNSLTPRGPVQEPIRRRPLEQTADAGMGKGPEVTDGPSDSTSSKAASDPDPAPQAGSDGPAADDFQPDIPPDVAVGIFSAQVPPQRSGGDFSAGPAAGTAPSGAGDPLKFDAPREPPLKPSSPAEDIQLVPGANISGGRYRLLVCHGGAPHLQFWQALDTALDR
ncbi:MAG: lipid II flippase MurJ, partial [Mycobacterium sp.]